jgi:hypothetical protein
METELKAIAAAAIMRESRTSKKGYRDAGAYWDSQRVVDEGEEEVLPDVRHAGARELSRADDAPQVAAYQGDVGALHGDVRSGSHRDAHLGLGQRGGVV